MTRDELIKYIEEEGLGEDLDELVHDAKSAEAAIINNSGVDFQVEYLLESMSVEAIKEAVTKT